MSNLLGPVFEVKVLFLGEKFQILKKLNCQHFNFKIYYARKIIKYMQWKTFVNIFILSHVNSINIRHIINCYFISKPLSNNFNTNLAHFSVVGAGAGLGGDRRTG